jgi:hypothetical protein
LESGDKRGLNSLNTLVPHIFLKISGDLEFGGNYSTNPHKNQTNPEGFPSSDVAKDNSSHPKLL